MNNLQNLTKNYWYENRKADISEFIQTLENNGYTNLKKYISVLSRVLWITRNNFKNEIPLENTY